MFVADGSLDFDPQHIFIPYRGYCARKSVINRQALLYYVLLLGLYHSFVYIEV